MDPTGSVSSFLYLPYVYLQADPDLIFCCYFFKQKSVHIKLNHFIIKGALMAPENGGYHIGPES